MIIKKSVFVAELAIRLSISQQEAKHVLDVVIDQIRSHLSHGDRVGLTGFGSFEVVNRAPRKGRNPRDGSPVYIPGGKKPRFVPSPVLKSSL